MLKPAALGPLLTAAVATIFSVVTVEPASAQRYQDRQYRAYGWTGFYFGGSIGARYTDAKWVTSRLANINNPNGPLIGAAQPDSDQVDSRSFNGALHTGYNWHAGSWVWGIEGDVGFARSSKSLAGFPGTAPTTVASDKLTAQAGNDGSLRLRAGVLLSPNTLWYATGGLAVQDAQLRAACPTTLGWCTVAHNESVGKTLLGYTLGGGVETAISRHWLARIEYRYSDFGKFDHTFFVNTPDDRLVGTGRFDSHKLGVGLSYKY